MSGFNWFLGKVTACGIKVYSQHGQELTNLLQTNNCHVKYDNGIGRIQYPTDEEELWGLWAYQQCLDHRFKHRYLMSNTTGSPPGLTVVDDYSTSIHVNKV